MPFQPNPHQFSLISPSLSHTLLSLSLSLSLSLRGKEKKKKLARTLSLSLYTEAKETQVIQIRKKRHGNSTHPILKNNEESTPPNSLSLFLQWPSWTKIYVKKKNKKEKRRYHRKISSGSSRCLQMLSSNQTHLTSQTHYSVCLKYPSATPQKNPIFITVSSLNSLKKTFFSPNYVGFFGFSLSWSEFHRENRKARTFPSLSLIFLYHPPRSHLVHHSLFLSSHYNSLLAFFLPIFPLPCPSFSFPFLSSCP